MSVTPPSTPSTPSPLVTFLTSQLTSLVVTVGLIVLMAMKVLDTSTGVPVVAGIAGVHLGANVKG